jgi:hypothetical protein
LRERAGVRGMKKRVSILIEEEVFRQAKRLVVKEGRPLSDVIHDALVSYLSTKVREQRKRFKAYKLFCEQPIRISRTQLKNIMETDSYSE